MERNEVSCWNSLVKAIIKYGKKDCDYVFFSSRWGEELEFMANLGDELTSGAPAHFATVINFEMLPSHLPVS